MATPDPNKSLLPNPDPVNVTWHRLFLFWESYEKEFINFLMDWHNDTAGKRTPGPGPARSTGNVLFDSFLDTWGMGDFVDHEVPLEKKSYFAALGVPSIAVRDECLKVLKRILKTQEGEITNPPEPIDEGEANDAAQKELETLSKEFGDVIKTLKTKIDPCVEKAYKESNGDDYLEALLRMMRIETRCFEVQKHFLDTGKVLPGGP
jgi:hypothetical protein